MALGEGMACKKRPWRSVMLMVSVLVVVIFLMLTGSSMTHIAFIKM